ncbi:MAG: PIN domain-containing protein [Pseudomonadota bacterium]
MTRVSDRFVVVLDANVLYGQWKRDIMLRFGAAGLFRPRWSQQILGELERALLRNNPGKHESISRTIKRMCDAFPEADVAGHECLIESFVLPDENDRHVLAAAVLSGAEHIITDNLKYFPTRVLKPLGIEAVRADDFLTATFELYEAQSVAELRKMRAAYKRNPLTASEFIFSMQKRGLPKLASLAKLHIDVL